MSEDSMQGICSAMVADYAAISRYCELKKQGELNTLRSVIEGAFGHSDDTARQRVNYLLNAKIIILHGKGWKFNTTGKKDAIDNMDLLKSLRDNPSVGEPSSEESIDEANRLKYRAPQE
jgi:hypothetical protein